MNVPSEMIVSVSQVNAYVKVLISSDENLHYLMVKGEISNFKFGAGGHLYFSLKDNKSMISVVMFKDYAKTINFIPKDGDEVTILASLDVYEARGSYQLYAKQMEKKGLGSQLVELEELKRKLQAEGLFDKNKRKINIFPKAIGIITALNSAAIKDLLTNIKRRYPIADIYVFPSKVQGADAPKELLKAFNKSQEYPLDTLIIGRGGGASEDLSAFNDETLVRAISNSKMPIISAVGHEIDYTLLDYVADVRVSTPTGAAEKATVDVNEVLQTVDYYMENNKTSLLNYVKKMNKDKEDNQLRLINNMKFILSKNKTIIEGYKKELSALNPTNILERGYSITLDENNKVIKSSKDVKENQTIKTILNSGELISTVKEKN